MFQDASREMAMPRNAAATDAQSMVADQVERRIQEKERLMSTNVTKTSSVAPKVLRLGKGEES
jgi:hypothetical protein